MRIHDFGLAPNPRKLRIYLKEKGIDVEFVPVNLLAGEQKSPEYLEKNPLGNVPTLELDDGSFLTESLAIIELFEELHPEPPMIGTDPIERARVRRLERIADLGVLGHVGMYVHTTNSPLGLDPIPEVAATHLQMMEGPLAVLDAELEGRPFIAGDRPTIADCTLVPCIEFARFAELDVPAVGPGYPNIRRWYDEFSKRESVQLPF